MSIETGSGSGVTEEHAEALRSIRDWLPRSLTAMRFSHRRPVIPLSRPQYESTMASLMTTLEASSSPAGRREAARLLSRFHLFMAKSNMNMEDLTVNLLIFLQNDCDAKHISPETAARYASILAAALRKIHPQAEIDNVLLSQFRRGIRNMDTTSETKQAPPMKRDHFRKFLDLAPDEQTRAHLVLMRVLVARFDDLQNLTKARCEYHPPNDWVVDLNGITKPTKFNATLRFRADHILRIYVPTTVTNWLLSIRNPAQKMFANITEARFLRLLSQLSPDPIDAITFGKNFTLHSNKRGAADEILMALVQAQNIPLAEIRNIITTAERHIRGQSSLDPGTVRYHTANKMPIACLNGTYEWTKHLISGLE